MTKKAPKPFLKPGRPARSNYYYKFQIDGLLYGPICCFTNDRREAERITADAYAEAAGKAAKLRRVGAGAAKRPKDMTLDELCVSYWTGHVKKKKLKDQSEIYRQLKVLRDTIGRDVLVSTIDDGVVEDFATARQTYVSERTKKTLKPNTRNHELMRLQNILGHAKTKEKIATHVIAWKDVRVAKNDLDVRPNRYITPEESAAIYAAMRPDYRSIFEMEYATGLRRRCLVNLTWDMVDESAGAITFKQKGNRDHLVVITPDIAAILEGAKPFKTARNSAIFTFVAQAEGTWVSPKTGKAYVQGQRYPITYWGIGSYWKGLIRRLNIPHANLHDFRKTFTSDFILAAGLSQASLAAGHSSERVTEEFYKSIPSPERERAAQLAYIMRLDKGRFVPLVAETVPQIVPQASTG